MFEIECKNPDEIILTTKKTSIKFNVANETISANLNVGEIQGPGEFEIGDVAIRGLATGDNGRTAYEAVIGNVHIGIIGDNEQAAMLDELGVSDVLCTSSVRAVREVEPKVVIAMGNVDGMVMELKLTPRAEKKYKLKNFDALPAALEVIALT